MDPVERVDDQIIVPGVAVKDRGVGAAPAVIEIGAEPANQPVVARAAEQLIVVVVAEQRIVPAAARNDVVSRQRMDDGRAGVGRQHVAIVAVRQADFRHSCDPLNSPRC